MTDRETVIAALVEQHARRAVIPAQCHNEAYDPTQYEVGALKNMRHILSQFADTLLQSIPASHEEKADD